MSPLSMNLPNTVEPNFQMLAKGWPLEPQTLRPVVLTVKHRGAEWFFLTPESLSRPQEWEERRRQNIEKMNEEMEKIAEYERNQRVSARCPPRRAEPLGPVSLPTPIDSRARRKACWSPTRCGTSWMTPGGAAGPWRSPSGTEGKAAAGTGATGAALTSSGCAAASSRSGRWVRRPESHFSSEGSCGCAECQAHWPAGGTGGGSHSFAQITCGFWSQGHCFLLAMSSHS